MKTVVKALLTLLLVTPTFAQASVLVYPVEFVDIAAYPETAQLVEKTVTQGGRTLANIDESINLTEYRDRCADENLCLVQIGQLVDAESVIVVKVRRGVSGTDSLNLRVIETLSGKVLKQIAWDVEPGFRAFRRALVAGLKQLLYAPDASIVFEVVPKKTTVRLYGKVVKPVESEQPVPLWSGDYFLTAEAPGYETTTRWLTVESGTFQRESIRLKPNSALIAEQSSGYIPRVDNSRKSKPPAMNPWSKWMAWGLFAGGAMSLGGGSLYMYSANQSFLELSEQSRNFTNNDQLLSAQEATLLGNELSGDYDDGRYIAIAGGVALLASTLWLLIDSLGDESE